MKKSLFTIIFLLSVNLGFSQDDNYKNLLTEYLNSQGTIQTFDATFAQMVNMFGAKLDEEKFNELKTEMISSLIDKMLPVYKNHFSESDLKAAILMYNTPIGKKISEKTILIAQESMQVSMDWGMEIGQKMQGLIK
jgi:hypothetical protein|tara:strand:+ start:89 stop:496 length:408 start_codon:yes stop_codon:yes gene_type:complete